jgi:Mg/Co/Ni transporter MgtE
MPRVADVAEREVSTCRLDERVGDVRTRHRPDGADPIVVVDHDHVVLGLVDAEVLGGDPAAPIERTMQPDPVSFRPDVRVGETPQYFKKHGVRHTLVTTSDGVLVGLLRMEQTGSASRP